MTRATRPAAVSRLAKLRIEPQAITIVAPSCLPAVLRWIQSCHGHADVGLEDIGAAAPPLKAGFSVAHTRLSGNLGGSANVSLKTQDAVPVVVGGHAEGRAQADHITRSGTYIGDLATDPTDQNSPKLSATVKARDLWLFPFAAVLFGAWIGWLFVRHREKSRPRAILQATLSKAVERHQKDLKDADPNSPPPYPLDPLVPSGAWNPPCPPQDNATEAERIFCDIGGAQTQEEFKDLQTRVDDIAAQVALWPEAVMASAELRQATADLPTGTEIRAACDRLVARTSTPADRDAATARITALREQREAALLWQRASTLETTTQTLWNELTSVSEQLPLWQRRLLVENHPRAVGAAYLDPAATLVDMNSMRPEQRLRECLYVLTELLLVHPSEVAEQLEPIKLAYLNAPMLEQDERPPSLIAAPPAVTASVPRSEQILHGVRVRDRWEFWFTFLITALVFFITIYPDDTFGSVWQYVAAVAAGAGGQIAFNWQLLPWFRSYRAAPAAA
jgi:hypothetical protein